MSSKYHINDEAEMISLGKKLGEKIISSQNLADTGVVIELKGDVGAGKTTFTRGLATGLGITDPITSPSFTISKAYAFVANETLCRLVHYDFYRLPDPGLMADELSETTSMPNTITAVEWADTVANILPENRTIITFSYNNDGTREVVV